MATESAVTASLSGQKASKVAWAILAAMGSAH
jgi:hypothetical protein